MPDKDTILRFVSENPDRANKRDIAKAFGLKGDTRAELKDLLRELEDEGLVERDRKMLRRPGALPAVAVLEITMRDSDGDLIARPAEWLEDHGAAPKVTVRQSNAGRDRGKKSRAPSIAAGIGDRVLARIFAAPHGKGVTYTAKIMKILDHRDGLILGVFRALPGGGGRLMPIERRGEEYAIDPDFAGNAKDGDLVEAEAALRETLSLADGAVEKDIARLTVVYETMKPKEAAALFEEMAPEFAAGFLARMRPEAAAQIMTGLSAEVAYTISVLMAGRNAQAPIE